MFGSDPNDYVLKSELATCCNGIGTVYLARHKPSNEYISIKKFQMDRAKLEENILIRVSWSELNFGVDELIEFIL